MAYILVFEGDLADGENPERHACQMLPSLLSEALPIPVLQDWAVTLWEARIEQELDRRVDDWWRQSSRFCGAPDGIGLG